MSFRFRDGSQVNGVPVERAVALITDWIAARSNESPSASVSRAIVRSIASRVRQIHGPSWVSPPA